VRWRLLSVALVNGAVFSVMFALAFVATYPYQWWEWSVPTIEGYAAPAFDCFLSLLPTAYQVRESVSLCVWFCVLYVRVCSLCDCLDCSALSHTHTHFITHSLPPPSLSDHALSVCLSCSRPKRRLAIRF